LLRTLIVSQVSCW